MTKTLDELAAARRSVTMTDFVAAINRQSAFKTREAMSVVNMVSWSLRAHSRFAISPIVQLITSARKTKDRVTTGTPGLERGVAVSRVTNGRYKAARSYNFDLAPSIHFGAYPTALGGDPLSKVSDSHPLGGASVAAAVNALDRQISRPVLTTQLLECADDSDRGRLLRPFMPQILGALLNFRQFPATGWRTASPDEIRSGLVAVFRANMSAYPAHIQEQLQDDYVFASAGEKLLYGVGFDLFACSTSQMFSHETREERADPRRGRTLGSSAFNPDEFFDQVIADESKYPPELIWSICRDLANVFDFEQWIPEVIAEFTATLGRVLGTVIESESNSLTSVLDASAASSAVGKKRDDDLASQVKTLSALNAIFTLTR